MLELSMTLPIKVQNGGLFLSRGIGRHPARTLSSWEIIFVEKGLLTIQEEENRFCVEAGESLLLWPQRRHVGVEDFPGDLRFYWLHFEVKAPDNDPRWLTHLSVPQHTRVVDPQALIALFRQFMIEQEKMQRSPALEFIVLLILQQMAQPSRPTDNTQEAGVSLAWKAQQLIRTQYHRPLSTAIMARELHCNADYLGRVYRRVFHLTLTEAIHRQRVRAAEKLLISDARSLKEVAEQCGFSDVGYFRQIFRKHTGLTPAVWKRRYCKEHVNS
ncbi:AraC family transcriptional regulator [Citrobacter sp. 50677481]|uniref:AraC family transcriptional regulator n=1 Tax=Citrobacter sp. 50677481 TaxID=1736699 RepID=UPI00074210C1|nr:AraC family transcriptional regulator [Citrobacter sp. 50677481]KSY28893.1 transcriptional regulator [Citrobacter sp. 50677481]HCQ7757049.1 helix-turn-helix transcriptional regulator [Citrobacter sedlakii]